MDQFKTAPFVKEVMAHAVKHYDDRKTRWDYVIECMSNQDIAEIIASAKTEKRAIWLMSRYLRAPSDYAADIRGA
jgi:hypothetical protein